MPDPRITTAAAQLLVEDLDRSLRFYEGVLRFSVDFVYEDFYASVTREGGTVHLKQARKLTADREHRREHEHLDVYFDTTGVDALCDEFVGRGARILRRVEVRPWGRRDFYLEDPDGYILCFSAPA